MPKIISLAVACCLALNGCQLFKKSPTWEKVVNVRPEAPRNEDPSRIYAEHLSRELAADHIEHKVVTYQYRFNTGLREESVGQRTAIIYRDDTDPRNPWWLKDEQLNRPIWLPNQEVDRQVAFYIRRHAEVVEAREVPGGEDKQMIGVDAPDTAVARADRLAPAFRTMFARRPVSAPAPMLARAEAPAQLKAVPVPKKSHPTPTRLIAKAPASKAAAARPQVVAQQEPAQSTDWNNLFRSMHGTGFDPSSELDREKMSTLHQVQLHEHPAAAATRTF